MSDLWDYLILTASNNLQAAAYETQLRMRRSAGHLTGVRNALVVADLDGRRIGSGASTLDCLLRVVNAERRGTESARDTLSRLRILIVHAGGDSRRLPAYGPAGKIFVPLPGPGRDGIPATLFDRLTPSYLSLAGHPAARGQVVVTAGDALILFDPASLRVPPDGFTMAGCLASPDEAARHGVFCVRGGDELRLYLQKPSIEVQRSTGALGPEGRSILDIGVMSFDAEAGGAMLSAFGIRPSTDGRLEWAPEMRARILSKGADLYREVCCAMGTDATLEHYIGSARSSGSKWADDEFAALFPGLRGFPVYVRVVPSCRFLHFGSTRQLVPSGEALAGSDRLSLNNRLGAGGRIDGSGYWVEGCRIEAPVECGGDNVLIGVDVSRPLGLPVGACLDVLAGRTRSGARVWFVRPHGVDDTFKHSTEKGGTFCGLPLPRWLELAGSSAADVWDEATAEADPTLWNARVFPAVGHPEGYADWLWFFDPSSASSAQRSAFRSADRYSAAEIAVLAEQDAFHARRLRLARE